MTKASGSPFAAGFLSAIQPPDRRPCAAWAEDNFVVDDSSPLPGPWRLANSPWVGRLMEAKDDPAVRYIVVKCAAQTSKTQTILVMMSHDVCEDPGPSMWVMAAQDEVKDFLRDRVMPSIQLCRKMRKRFLGAEGLTLLFQGMSFYFTGAGSKSKMQSKPIRRLYLDEVRNYPPGRLEMVLKRVRSFSKTAKVFIISTPDNASDDMEAHYRRGSMEVLHLTCPECGEVQPFDFARFLAVHPETRERVRWKQVPGAKTEKGWNLDVLGDAIAYPCRKCGHDWQDRERTRRQMAAAAVYVRTNPLAPRSVVSLQWPAFIAPWVSWKDVAEEYLTAVSAARMDPPDLDPLKAFWTETCGESWDESLGVVDDFNFLDDRREDYDFGDVWPEENLRLMAADRQGKGGEHYWWVIRSYGTGGRSRLVAYGRAETKEQLIEIAESYKVQPAFCMMDTAFQTGDCYRFCYKNGWKAFKGDNVEEYVVSVIDPQTRQPKAVRRVWTKSEVFADMMGTGKTARRLLSKSQRRRVIPLYRFADDMVKDTLFEMMKGLIPGWTLPLRVGDEYRKQVTAECRVIETDARGRQRRVYRKLREDNHFLDCEKMLLVAAIILKRVRAGTVRVSEAMRKLLPEGVDAGAGR